MLLRILGRHVDVRALAATELDLNASLLGHGRRSPCLPRRLANARDFSLEGEFAKSDAGEAEAAQVRARPSGELATIADPHRRRVARQRLQLAGCGFLLGFRRGQAADRRLEL